MIRVTLNPSILRMRIRGRIPGGCSLWGMILGGWFRAVGPFRDRTIRSLVKSFILNVYLAPAQEFWNQTYSIRLSRFVLLIPSFSIIYPFWDIHLFECGEAGHVIDRPSRNFKTKYLRHSHTIIKIKTFRVLHIILYIVIISYYYR